MAIVLDSKRFAEFHVKLAARFKPAVMRGVRAGAARAIPYLVDRVRNAIPANPGGKGSGGAVNTGALARGFRVLAEPEGAAIVNRVPYAANVDGGRRPGGKFPPRDALIPWIKRKLLTKPKEKKRRFGPRDTPEQAREKANQKRLEAAIKKVGAKDRKYGPKRAPQPKKRRGKRVLSADEQAARLYFPIARAIARRGLIARKILSAHEAHAHILELVTREVVSELARETGR